jgi:predicted TIM-barrel fold metal-dependent hydrolase
MSASATLAGVIDATPWVDTHEHLVEERDRLGPEGCRVLGAVGAGATIPADWSSLLFDYAVHDLVSAGLPAAAARAFLGPDLGPVEKWDLVAEPLNAARATGYVRAVDLSTERLFGLRLARDTCEEIDARLRDLRVEGYYEHVLRTVANVERCQVNSLQEDPFCETQTPDLLDQDLSLLPLALGRHDRAEQLSGIEVEDLDDYLDVIAWCFARYADRAVAVKCPWAYVRGLAVDELDARPVGPFRRLRAGVAAPGDRRRVEDFLFARCVELATEAGLPVKLHLGTLAGNGQARLAGVYDHVAEVTPLVQRHPATTFVLMHMGWPQQEQVLALAKHQRNVVVDLCWSWILAPRSAVDFVQRFLTTVPANKLLCFGGDVVTVESVVGHAEIARRGLQSALEGLVADRWIDADAALALVEPLMRGNAERILPTRAPGRTEATLA